MLWVQGRHSVGRRAVPAAAPLTEPHPEPGEEAGGRTQAAPVRRALCGPVQPCLTRIWGALLWQAPVCDQPLCVPVCPTAHPHPRTRDLGPQEGTCEGCWQVGLADPETGLRAGDVSGAQEPPGGAWV